MSRPARVAPLIVAIAGALYFGVTCARDLQPFDSAEFALNAVQFGVGHPPGQPLYLVLSALVVRALSFLSPSHALAWLSIAATVGAAAWAVVFALRVGGLGGFVHGEIREMEEIKEKRGVGVRNQQSSSDLPHLPALPLNNTPSPTRRRLAPTIAAALGAFLLPGVWDMATRAEVYPLAALCLAGAVFVALQRDVGDGDVAVQREFAALRKRRLAVIGVLLGLGAAVNPAMAVAAGVALGARVFGLVWGGEAGTGTGTGTGTRASGRIVGRMVGAALVVGGGVVGLGAYAVLGWIGAHPRDAVVWGEPLRGEAVWFYLMGRDYRAWHVGGAELVRNLGAATAWLMAEGILPWVVLGSLGFALSRLPRGAKVVLPVGAAVATGLLALNHPFIPSNPDYDGYLLPWVWLSVVGVALLGLELPSRTLRGRNLSWVVVVGLAVAGAAASPSLLARHRGGSHATGQIAESALQAAPDNAILLVESDHLAFGTIYLQEVEGLRRDVTVINAGWANSSWYLRYLARRDTRLPAFRFDAPSREARIAALLAEAGRPVAAERLALASLGGKPCMRGVLALAGTACDSSAGGNALHAVTAASEAADGDLDRRLVASYAMALATDDLAASHAPAFAFVLLTNAVPSGLLAGLRTEAPRAGVFVHPFTRLSEPRALLPPEALLIRLGDLLASTDPRAAIEYYRRADLPESERAIARLLDENGPAAQDSERPADVAPRTD